MKTGATVVYAGSFLGRKYETQAICTDWTENKRFATKTISGPFYIEIDTTLEPVGTGTRVTSLYRGESRGFFKFAEPLVVRMTKKQFETPADADGRRRPLLKAESAWSTISEILGAAVGARRGPPGSAARQRF